MESTPHQAPPARARWPRILLLGSLTLASLLAFALWWLGRPASAAWLLPRLLQEHGVQAQQIQGSLYGPLKIGRISWSNRHWRVTLHNLELDWRPADLLRARLEIDALQASQLDLEALLPDHSPARMPASLQSPLPLNLAQLKLARLVWLDHGKRLEAGPIAARLQADDSAIRLQQFSAQAHLHGQSWQLGGQLELAAKAPFALRSGLELANPALRLQADGDGNLGEMRWRAKLSQAASRQTQAEVSASLQSFATLPLQSLHIKAAGLNPAQIDPAWPQAELSLDLALQDSAGQAGQRHYQGRLQLHNHKAQGLEAHGLPLQQLQAAVQASLKRDAQQRLQADWKLSQAQFSFLRGGSLHGQAQGNAAGMQARFDAQGLDLQGLHSKMRPTRIHGWLEADSANSWQEAAWRTELRDDTVLRGASLQARGKASRQALELQQLRLQAPGGNLQAQGKLGLQGARAFQLQGELQHWNPARWGDFPAADVNARWDAQGSAPSGAAWQGQAKLQLLPGQLWKQELRGAIQAQAKAGSPLQLDANLELGAHRLHAQGQLASSAGQEHRLRWELALNQLQTLPPLEKWSGNLQAQGELRGSLQQSQLIIQAQGQDIRPTQAKGAAQLKLEAQLGLQAPYALQAKGEAQGLQAWGLAGAPPAQLNLQWQAQAALQSETWQIEAHSLPGSEWNKQALRLQGKVDWRARQLAVLELEAQAGANRISAQGGLGAPGAQLRWRAELPQVAQLGSQAGGALHAQGSLALPPHSPPQWWLQWPAWLAQAQGKAQKLSWGQHFQLPQAEFKFDWPGLQEDGPLRAQIKLDNLLLPDQQWEQIQLELDGKRSAHQLKLQVRGRLHDGADSRPLRATLAMQGGAQAIAPLRWEWRGQLKQLENRARHHFNLRQAAPLQFQLEAQGLRQFEAQHIILDLLENNRLRSAREEDKNAKNMDAAQGSIHLTRLRWQPQQWETEGEARQVSLNWLLPQYQNEWRSDLRLQGQWSLQATPQQLQGALNIARSSGDLRPGRPGAPALGLHDLQAAVQIRQGALNARLQAAGSQLGSLKLEAQTRLTPSEGNWRWSSATPLQAQAQTDLRTLAWLAPLLPLPDLDVDGRLHSNLQLDGSLAAPRARGTLQGRELSLQWPGPGIKLEQGSMDIQLDGEKLNLQSMRWRGGAGSLQARGEARLQGQEPSARLELEAQSLQLLSAPDRQLVLSGKSTLQLKPKLVEVQGKLRAERAEFNFAPQNSAVLSEDVVIKQAAPLKREAGQAVHLHLDFDFGDAFTLRAAGLQARLDGALSVRAFDRRGPRVVGNVAIREGVYQAYGQNLEIREGALNFTGAYDNPNLNLLAVRKGMNPDTGVEAGIELRGSLQAPQARLVSEPSVPDSEKLMWLILGRGSEGGSEGDNPLLALAINGLFGGAQNSKLVSALALDEINLSRAHGAESAVLTVGKRLSNKLFVTLEQGMGSASTLLKLRYTLNPRLSLQLQTGNNNALDAFYTWRFD
ncbi:translocation/assembly module TamB domain-containing protein [Massilia sp. W12]|uniref:translocation/assembly module TamB domain-containing protein n=1 Tax=Massilia sp. W12 TaxID=3126507 RepID=UPI0030D36F1D